MSAAQRASAATVGAPDRRGKVAGGHTREPEQVTLGHDPREPAAVDDGHVADSGAREEHRGVAGGRVARKRDDRGAHHLADGRRQAALGKDDPPDDILPGKDSDRATIIVDDRHRPDALSSIACSAAASGVSGRR
jgi:hypothetical protein